MLCRGRTRPLVLGGADTESSDLVGLQPQHGTPASASFVGGSGSACASGTSAVHAKVFSPILAFSRITRSRSATSGARCSSLILVLLFTGMRSDPSKTTCAVTTPLGLPFRIAPSASTTKSGYCFFASCLAPVLAVHGRLALIFLQVLRLKSNSSSTTGLPRAPPPDSRRGLLCLPISTFSSWQPCSLSYSYASREKNQDHWIIRYFEQQVQNLEVHWVDQHGARGLSTGVPPNATIHVRAPSCCQPASGRDMLSTVGRVSSRVPDPICTVFLVPTQPV